MTCGLACALVELRLACVESCMHKKAVNAVWWGDPHFAPSVPYSLVADKLLSPRLRCLKIEENACARCVSHCQSFCYKFADMLSSNRPVVVEYSCSDDGYLMQKALEIPHQSGLSVRRPTPLNI